jgi:hypothetical protein
MVGSKGEGVEDGSPNTVPPMAPPDAPIGSGAAPTPAESSANPGISTTVQEPPKPMLEVHAPYEALRSWKSFFIHIATIVIGLLIAIGLEQTVEFFHHRHQVAEARKAIDLEVRLNINRFGAETEGFRRYVPILQSNPAVFQYLKQHPGAPPAQWPGMLEWTSFSFTYLDDAWKTAQQSGVLEVVLDSDRRLHFSDKVLEVGNEERC